GHRLRAGGYLLGPGGTLRSLRDLRLRTHHLRRSLSLRTSELPGGVLDLVQPVVDTAELPVERAELGRSRAQTTRQVTEVGHHVDVQVVGAGHGYVSFRGRSPIFTPRPSGPSGTWSRSISISSHPGQRVVSGM
ncbi:hypothetical protein STRTUCAR8_03635, partial [Streptomyces turgidiscabies Car8]